jgi:hypothetical protein
VQNTQSTGIVKLTPTLIKKRGFGGISSLIAICLLLFFACKIEEVTQFQNQTAFYFWKTEFSLDKRASQYLTDLGAHKLYVRVFDLALEDGQAVPIAPIQAKQKCHYPVVPVVFITSAVWQRKDGLSHDSLAHLMITLLKEKHKSLTDSILREVQLDCDWTKSSQKAWFDFLRIVKSSLPKDCTLSVTIRLHQYKYPKETGIPPADRGMLMVYNTGQINDQTETNSILTAETTRKYLSEQAHYPLPLDIALPSFQWVLVYRLGSLHHIMHQCTTEALTDTSRFEANERNQLTSKKNQLIDGYYLHKDDVLRLEYPDTTLLMQVKNILDKNLETKPHTTSFYHLDSFAMQHYRPEFLRGLAQ